MAIKMQSEVLVYADVQVDSLLKVVVVLTTNLA